MAQGEASRPSAPDWVAGFDFWRDEEHHEDPYAHYRELRDKCPVAFSEALGGYWICSRYDDTRDILDDTRRFSNRYLTVPDSEEEFGLRIPSQLDPPEHSVYRGLLLPLFNPNAAKALEVAARAVIVGLLEPVVANGECEFVEEVAARFPEQFLLPWLGVPPEGIELLSRLDADVIRKAIESGDLETAADAKRTAARYWDELGASRRATGPIGNDALSFLVAADIDGRPLDAEELRQIMMLLYAAAMHTTISTVGNAMAYLAVHPEAHDELVADASLIPAAVEELMRYESVLATRRTPLVDVEIHGQTIRAGEPIMLFLGSSGRDERVFENPDVVDFHRPFNRHLNFGAGPHRCLGSHIARVELRVVLEEIHRMIPNYRAIPGRPIVRHTGLERTVHELWLAVD